VLGGIMVMIGLLLFDGWSIRLAVQWLRGRRSHDMRLNLLLVAAVCVASVVWGFAIGVAIGAALAVVLFIRSMDRSLIRARRRADEQPSRRIYVDAHEAALKAVRPSIVILELEGALFFGSGDRLVREVDALDADCRTVVMDLQRVGLVDASGAMILSQIHRRLEERDVALLLAGVMPHTSHGKALVEFAGDSLPPTAWHPDVDRAVEDAELRALAAVTTESVDTAVLLGRSALMTGLDAVQCARLAGLLERRALVAGERLFAQGDPGDRLYVLTEGSISILGARDGAGAGTPRVRYVTCSPGMMLGEIAMLDHRGRSGEAVADTASEVYALSEATLQALEIDEPILAALVYRNIAVHLSTRLRIASNVQIASTRAAEHEHPAPTPADDVAAAATASSSTLGT
jgi:sulfate permease, SulP family